MLRITIPSVEYFDEATGTFVTMKEQTLQLEHSLVSLSKWESKWRRAFLDKGPKNQEETLDYIRCMTVTQNVDPIIYNSITPELLVQIRSYVEDPMTATTISKKNERPNRDITTSEIIYYWMISLDIPIECEKWHLNRLLMLIKVCNIKNGPQKKMSKKDLLAQTQALNAARRSGLNTRG